MGELSPFLEFARLHALADDGHCRAYSDDATGTVWGEGAGMVLVERESRARHLGHRVYARVLAVRNNHNGKGKPILVPRTQAQAQVIRKALDHAGIDPADVGMIEGHGTATPAGDPRELNALFQTYGAAGSNGVDRLDQVQCRTRPGGLRNSRADQGASLGLARLDSADSFRGQPHHAGGLGIDRHAPGDKAAHVGADRRRPCRGGVVVRCRRSERARNSRHARNFTGVSK